MVINQLPGTRATPGIFHIPSGPVRNMKGGDHSSFIEPRLSPTTPQGRSCAHATSGKAGCCTPNA